MNKDELIQSIFSDLDRTVFGGFVDPYMPLVKDIVETQIGTYFSKIVSELDKQIQLWETEMEGKDVGLYSLGLREAKDLLLGENPFIKKSEQE